MRQRSDSPKPSFRNTRSKFFQKKPTAEQKPSHESPQVNTGLFWKDKGNASFKRNQIDEAILFYTKAIEVGSAESIYFSNRAKCHKIKGNLKDALKDSEEACELDEKNIKAHYICGCILAELGKKDGSKISKSENRLKKALRLCDTLKKPDFIDQISIKLYRLRKLIWYMNKWDDYQVINEEIKLLAYSFESGLTTKQRFEVINANKKKHLQEFNVKREIPDQLCCKITLELMEDPVCTQAGFSYERAAIQDHVKTNGLIEPITRKPIEGKIYPNIGLKRAVQQFLVDKPWAYEYVEGEDFMKIEF